MIQTLLNKKLKRLYWALFLLIISFLIGIIGFMRIEDYTLLDAFYMGVITVATIGYQEIRQLSDAGKIFNSFYILANLALFAFVISTLTSYIFEGELKNIFKKYKAEKIIKKMKNHIVVCGYGRNGFNVCQDLNRLQVPYVLIERSEQHLHHFEIKPHRQYIIGDAALEETLLEANIKEAKALIIALPNDANNVFIMLTARELNPDIYIVCRASEQSAEKKMYRAGANKVIMPEALGGIHMAQLITKPHIIEFLDLLNGMDKLQMQLDEISMKDLKSEFRNSSIKDLQQQVDSEINIIALKDKQKGFVFNPKENEAFSEDKVLIILGAKEAIRKFKEKYLV
ncbi:MAG: potassium channel family protein [Raineya sp.]